MGNPPAGQESVTTQVVEADDRGIDRCARALAVGELVAFATETVYGLGADARSPAAVRAVYEAKQRPFADPLIVHVADADDAGGLGDLDHADGVARRLVEAFWPGPLTVVVPRHGGLAPEVSGTGTVGLRCPAHPDARDLIRRSGVPVAAPSANRFGRVSPTDAHHVLEELGGRIRWILDSGPTPLGVESTVLRCTGDGATLLRPGGVTVEDITEVLGDGVLGVPPGALVAPSGVPAQSPGTSLSHYAPGVPLVLTDAGERVADDLADALASGGMRVARLRLPTGDAAARELYGALRALDEPGGVDAPDVAVTSTVDPAGLGRAVNDRLFRAAHGHIATDATEGSLASIRLRVGA
ncbi:MAG: threonylcarbamoyl-AMP synthase [Actinomycetia bacterium]|nr:threonylcarbamoyl-AMP synthase [Actinomycetes bacterium]